MGRPPRYDADFLLDCAVQLVVDRGPAAVTVAGVASAAGAPSGSVYHRFSGRTVLLAALWLRTVHRFQVGFFATLTGPEAIDAALAAALHTVTWSRENPTEAQLLLHGPNEFGYADWRAEDREQAARDQHHVAAAMAKLTRRLGLRGAAGRDRVTFAVIDVPLALVGRHVRRSGRVPGGSEDLVATTVRALLS